MCFRMKYCCGCNDLQKGAKIIAIVGILFSCLSFLGNYPRVNVGSIASGLLGFLINGMLYFGAANKRRGLVMTWMIIEMIVIVAYFIFMAAIIVFIIIINVEESEAKDDIVDQLDEWFDPKDTDDLIRIMNILCGVMLGILLISQLICIYFWSAVYSFYMELKESQGIVYPNQNYPNHAYPGQGYPNNAFVINEYGGPQPLQFSPNHGANKTWQ